MYNKSELIQQVKQLLAAMRRKTAEVENFLKLIEGEEVINLVDIQNSVSKNILSQIKENDEHPLPFVLNLEPRKIRGIESNAMIILGETVNSKKLFMISPLVFDDVIPSGDGWKELTGAIII